MIEYSALIAVLLVIGYFVYHGVTHKNRRMVAEAGPHTDASWQRTTWPGTRPGMTIVRRADRIDIEDKDIERKIAPAAGPR